MNKIQLRKEQRLQQLKLTAEQRQAAALTASQCLFESELFQHSQHIACYFPSENEFDCLPIIKAIWQANKSCYLPVLPQKKQKLLQFVAYQPEQTLVANRYNILEPEMAGRFLPSQQLDLVLVPLLAVNKQGYRLGSGGGYYDYTFAYLLNEPRPKTPKLIGLGYSQQSEIDFLPEEWDVPLDGLLTEQGWQWFASG